VAINALDIKKITEELKLIITGGKVEKIYQHTDNDLIITLYNRNTYHLYFNIESGMTRLHLLSERPEAQKSPRSIIMQMRKYINNSIITDINQINEDRIVKIEFTTKTTKFYIIAELIDKGANIIFLSQNQKILGTIRPEKGKKKGIPYELPDKPDMDINSFNLTCPSDDGKLYNECLEEKYQIRTKKSRKTKLYHLLTSPIKKEIKKTKKLIKNLKGDLEKAGSYEKYLKYGQLLQSNFYKLNKGLNNITVEDYETGDSIDISIDPKLSPQDNVERYFKRSKKAKSAEKIIPKKIEQNEKKLDILMKFNSQLSEVKEREEALQKLDKIKEEYAGYYNKYLLKSHKALLENRVTIPSKVPSKSAYEKEPFRYFLSTAGQKIYVARNNRENDELTFQFANGNDEWIHTRDYPGSHVVVPLGKNEDINGKTLEEACQLALHFSKAKGEKSADLYRTKRKYLSKPKNAPSGKVNISRYSIINVLFNEKLLNRVMERKNE
jgi:predicted ribosome quality control (RQC) complex YloA/Tae2 family protein